MTSTATSAIAIWDQRYAKKAGVDRCAAYVPWLDRWQLLLASPPGRALDLVEKLTVWRYDKWKSIFEVIARKHSD